MGRPEEALGHVEPALASAREQRLVYEEALLLVIKAQTGVDNGDAFEEAERLLEDLGASTALCPPLAVADVVDDVDLDERPQRVVQYVEHSGDPATRLDQTRGMARWQISERVDHASGRSPAALTRGSL